jgi:GNAT superfamily N-acetyltransferase
VTGPALTFRRAVPADACALRDLTRAAYAKWVPVIGREPLPMQTDFEAAVRSHRFDLAYDGEVLVGLIETVDEGDRLLVENVAVAPDRHGQGIGTQLMALADDIARASGHGRLRLFTNGRFEANIQLYQRLGYAIDGEEPIDGGMVRVNMSKRLA